jgi:PAS domain S-box-containing protein
MSARNGRHDSSLMTAFLSRSAVFSTDRDGVIRGWNAACAQITGFAASEVESRPCWEVLAGVDRSGIVCHRRCSIRRDLRCGFPMECGTLTIRTRFGPKQVTISTIVLHDGAETTVLHTVADAAPSAAGLKGASYDPGLTRRQSEILELLAEGVGARDIAGRLALSEPTVRNHIQAILRALGCHSQLEAVARARALTVD